MKGTEEPSDFLLKIIEIALISVTLIGTYFMVVDYNVTKLSADPQRQALLIADGVLNCKAAYVEPSVLDTTKPNFNTLIANCMSPFTNVANGDYYIKISGGTVNQLIGTESSSKQLFVTYAVMLKTNTGVTSGLVQVYVKKA